MENILIYRDTISKVCERTGKEIFEDIKDDEDVLFLGLLNGGMFFTMDTIRHIQLASEVMFAHPVANIDDKVVGWKYMPAEEAIENRTIIVFDNISNTGKTLSKVKWSLLNLWKAKKVKVAVLIDDPSARQVEFKPDFVGLTIRIDETQTSSTQLLSDGKAVVFNKKYHFAGYGFSHQNKTFSWGDIIDGSSMTTVTS